MKNSLVVLSESLDMKLKLLEDIQDYNEKQRAVFDSGEPNIDDFDSAIDEKDALIERMMKLDDGFEALYKEIAEELKENRMKYADMIKEIQDKITRVLELSASVQVQESRNKKLIEDYFIKQRQGIRQNRVSSKAAYDYYRNMTGMNLQTPGFLDSKN